MKYIEEEDKEFVENIIKKYSQISPIKNNVLDISIFETTFKLIRLNDEQYSMLRKNCVTLLVDYGFLTELSTMGPNYENFPKMYITLKTLFGESGECYDDWKGCFSFPFLIHFEKDGIGFDYLMNVFTMRSSNEFMIDKIISADNTEIRKEVLHEPFEESEYIYWEEIEGSMLKGEIKGIKKYRFDEEKLEEYPELTIFRIGIPSTLNKNLIVQNAFITEFFIKRALESGLTGFEFSEAWNSDNNPLVRIVTGKMPSDYKNIPEIRTSVVLFFIVCK